jgi:Gram-negative bacterial tonB protein.
MLQMSFVVAQEKVTVFSFEKSDCMGKCPVFMLELKDNGQMTYIGKSNTDKIGTWRAVAPKSQTKKMLDEIEKVNWRNKESKYQVVASDLPRLHINVSLNGEAIRISNADSGPDELMELAIDLEVLARKVKWRKISSNKNYTYQFTGNSSYTSTSSNKNSTIEETLTQTVRYHADVMPEFPGGKKGLSDYINENLTYPKQAQEKMIQGRVIVGFIIDEHGQVQQPTILSSIGGGCDEEALRIIKQMPPWKPAIATVSP